MRNMGNMRNMENMGNMGNMGNMENIEMRVLYPKFKSSASIFGIIDILQMLILSLSLIALENMPTANIILIFIVKLVYVFLVIRYKPSANNTLMAFSEVGNLILATMSTIFALDDKYNWITEERKIVIGWIGITCVFGNIIIQVLLGLFQLIRKHESKFKICCKKIKIYRL